MTVRPGEADHRARALARPEPHPSADVVARAIHDIELGLLRDDRHFVRRMHRLRRARSAAALAVVLLLVASVVLLTVGLATQSLLAWVAGGLAFALTFAVDGRRGQTR